MRRLEGAAVPEEGMTEKRVGNKGRHILIHTDVGHMDYPILIAGCHLYTILIPL